MRQVTSKKISRKYYQVSFTDSTAYGKPPTLFVSPVHRNEVHFLQTITSNYHWSLFDLLATETRGLLMIRRLDPLLSHVLLRFLEWSDKWLHSWIAVAKSVRLTYICKVLYSACYRYKHDHLISSTSGPDITLLAIKIYYPRKHSYLRRSHSAPAFAWNADIFVVNSFTEGHDKIFIYLTRLSVEAPVPWKFAKISTIWNP